MRDFIMRIILLAFVAGFFPAAASAADQRFKDQMLAPLVKINQDCSASIISSEKNADGKVTTQLLTAKHCVTDEGVVNIEMFDDDGLLVESRNVWFDKDRVDYRADLGLLTLRDKTNVYPTVIIADHLVAEQGDRVWAVGFPFGETKSVTEGLFNGIQRVKFPDAFNTFYRSTPPVSPGNSGGALFQKNGDNYEQIGVTSAGIPKIDHSGIFVRLNEIQKFLRIKPVVIEISIPATMTLPEGAPEVQ